MWLGIDTAGDVCSVGLYSAGALEASLQLFQKRKHIQKLAVFIEQILAHAGKTVQDLEAVVLTQGPGSYTGLRIGSATAKGVCFSIGIPMAAISSLSLIAATVPIFYPLGATEILICANIDAGKKHAYVQYFNSNLSVQTPCQRMEINIKNFEQALNKQKIIFVGNASSVFRSQINHENAIYISDTNCSSMEALGKLGYDKIQNKDFVNVDNFEPIYNI